MHHVVGEGMVVSTESDKIKQARKSMLELLLGNHPLDCPVCDAGGECELQDMTFKYGAAESKYIELKNHREEQQWSPVVYFDRPRCILVLSLHSRLRRGHGRVGAGHPEPRLELASSRPIKKTIWSAKSAACASTSARSAR